MTVKPEPVIPMNRFKARYGSTMKKTTAEQPTPAEQKDEDKTQKKEEKKKRRTTNDLSELAEILEEAKNETDTSKAEKGESEMADVNNDERGLVAVNNGNKKGNETAITDEMEVNLTSLEVKACALAGIDLKDFIGKSKDEIKAIWEKKDYFIDGDRILYKGKPVEQSEINAAILKHIITPLHPDKNIIGDKNKSTKLFQNIHSVLTKGGKFKLRQTTEEYPNIDGILKKPLSLENKKNKNTELAVIPKTEIVKYKDEQDTPTPQPTPAEHTDLHWINEKIRDYTKMKEDGKAAIKEFNGDKTAGTFTAEIDNGTVTYTSPNDVSVTKDSSYKVFDTMMKEPSNAGKIVCLPEDATAEFRTNLFVAAVLNGYKVNGAEGLVLDEATLAKIDLGEKEAQVRAALQKQEKAPTEKTTQEKPSEKVAEAITKLEDTQAKLAELVKDGKVSATISSNAETKRSEIVFNFDASKGGNQANADEANKLFTEARKSFDDLRQEALPPDENLRKQAVVDNYALKSAQLGLIRSVYQPEPSEAVKAMDRVRAKRLGLETGEVKNKNGDTVKTLEGDALNNYQSNMSANILSRIKAGHEGK